MKLTALVCICVFILSQEAEIRTWGSFEYWDVGTKKINYCLLQLYGTNFGTVSMLHG